MFTGIVEELGSLVSSEPSAEPAPPDTTPTTRLVFRCTVVLAGTTTGDSISVNGCCLTVVDQGPDWWAADAVAETLARTALGELRPGDPVNLERPVTLETRLGGHLVQGHVDGVGRIVNPAPDLQVSIPPGIHRYLVEKGSITVDGISLTVVSVTTGDFSVAVIPHTMAVTTLGHKVAGDPVNLEVDVIAKYTEALLRGGVASPYQVLKAEEGQLSE